MSKRWKYGVIGLLATGLVAAYLLTPKRSAGPVLPVPNGYDDLLKAAQDAVSHRHLAYGEASDAELRELVHENRSALTSARLGCTRECRVATDCLLTPAAYWGQHMPVLAQFKKLALAFRAEGELAEREGRTNHAARVYLDGVRFCQEVCRGGLVIDRLVGIACEVISLAPLNALLQDLDARTCQELAHALEQMDAKREPLQATWDEERHWSSRAGDLRERIGGLIVRLVKWRAILASRKKDDLRLAQTTFQERDLMLHLAARAYRLDHGKPPERPGDLVPEYLRAIPKDPVTD